MNINLLSQIFGEVAALFMLPILRPRQTGWGGWVAAYKETGLGFADSRKQAESLRKLAAAGLLVASGATQGRAFRLTFKGALLGSAYSGIFVKDCRAAARKLQRAQAKTSDSLPGTDWPIVMGYRLIREAGKNWEKVGSDPQKYTLAMVKCVSLLLPLLICGHAELYPSHSGQAFALHLHTMPTAKMWQVDNAPSNDLQVGEGWKAHCEGFDNGIARFSREPPAAFSGVVPCLLPATRHRS